MTVSALATDWWAWAAPLAAHVLVLAAAVFVIDRLLERRGWPQLRMALWFLVAVRFVLPPSMTSPLGVSGWTGAGGAEIAPDGPTFDTSPLFLVWLAGAVVAGALHVRRVRLVAAASRGAPAPGWIHAAARHAAHRLGLTRVPTLVVSAHASTAYVHGVFRPRVVLPASVSPADVRSMLLHEFAHVKRGDLAVDAALAALCAVFWFHPAAWLVRRRVAHLREICCDATVAAALGPRAEEYRRTLLRAAATLLDARAPTPAFLGGRSQIVARLRALERGPPRSPRLRLAVSTALALVLGAAVLPATPSPLDAARRCVAAAMDGTSRPGCLRLHLAAMQIAADSR